MRLNFNTIEELEKAREYFGDEVTAYNKVALWIELDGDREFSVIEAGHE